MASYRDPPGAGIRTFEAYDRAVEWGVTLDSFVGSRVRVFFFHLLFTIDY
jgi:hypothetical protein